MQTHLELDREVFSEVSVDEFKRHVDRVVHHVIWAITLGDLPDDVRESARVLNRSGLWPRTPRQ